MPSIAPAVRMIVFRGSTWPASAEAVADWMLVIPWYCVASLSPSLLAAAPHRLLFFGGAANVLLAAGAAMLWRSSLRPTPVAAPEKDYRANIDAMLAKVIAWAPTRDAAIERLETDLRFLGLVALLG